MQVAEIKNDIKSGSVRDFYIFNGDEWKVQEIYINQLAKAKNLRIKRINSINDIYVQLRNKSFLSSNFCYVVRDDEAFISNEQLWSQVKNSKIFAGNIYILQLTNLDKRTKFYKAFQDEICVFEHLEPRILKKYIQKEIDLNDKNCQDLMEICEYDYGRCLLEIDKIKNYAEHELFAPFTQDVVHWELDDVFEILVKEGAIYQPPKDAIFDFVDAVLRKKVNLSLELLQECYDIGEATMVMLTVLFNNVRSTLQVQTYHGDNLSKATGLTGWEIKLAKSHIGYYTDDWLEYMLLEIQRVESGIKQGKIEEEFAMRYLLGQIM